METRADEDVWQQEAAASQYKRKPAVRSKLVTVIVASLLIIPAGGIAILHQLKKQPDILPGQIQAAVSFPLYTPKNQALFQLDKQSITTEDSVVTFAGTYDGKPVVISQQAMPKDFNMSLLSGGTTHQLDIGTGYTTDLGSRLTGVIHTRKTLITITTPGQDETTVSRLVSEF